MGHTKEHHAARQGAGEVIGLVQPGQHLAMQLRPQGAQGARPHRGQQRAPQQRLPGLIGRQLHGLTMAVAQHVPALRPVAQPIGPVDLVLVQQVGQTLGQLQQALGVVVVQKAGHRRKARLQGQIRQKAHQAPGQRGLVQRGIARHALAPQHLAVKPPLEACGQFHPRGGAHAHRASQRHLQPLGHAVALHQHDLVFQRRERLPSQPAGHRLGQQFGAVAVQNQQAGGKGCAHAASIGRKKGFIRLAQRWLKR